MKRNQSNKQQPSAASDGLSAAAFLGRYGA